MYGLQRGSCDWGRKARRVIVYDVKGTYIGDHGEGSLFAYVDPTGEKKATLIIVYADDFDVVGPDEDRIYNLLGEKLLFDHTAGEAESNLEELIGMEFWRAPPSTSGLAHIVMHQYRYASMIVAEYEQRHNKGKPLKPLYTPMVAREERGSEE